MYAKSTRPSAKREVQKFRSAKRDDRIARPRRAQTCERSARWECAREAGRFFYVNLCRKKIIIDNIVCYFGKKILCPTDLWRQLLGIDLMKYISCITYCNKKNLSPISHEERAQTAYNVHECVMTRMKLALQSFLFLSLDSYHSLNDSKGSG